MTSIKRHLTSLCRFAFAAAILVAAAQWTTVSAQNPGAVLVEGNCNGGQTAVSPATVACGDYDGDGLLGTAEDTDGDAVYGTIQGALEAIDHNGKVVVVTSGIFNENVYIGQQFAQIAPLGALDPGNVTLEAAPGVEAVIDAFAQTGPAAAGNNARAAGTGIAVNYTLPNGPNRRVTLRNLQVRNFTLGVTADNETRINLDKLRVENNLNVGIRISNNARAEIVRTHVTDTCYRIAPVAGPPCSPGYGIFAQNNSFLKIYDSVVSKNGGIGVFAAVPMNQASAFNLVTQFNNGVTQHFGLHGASIIYDF